ncbi:MAG TPA: DUF4124 domain-containing protein [Gammaproteobacteria bacterium]|jgi:hypothetical protein|nr:DUF4124 domain-containing protein [Gammaproteobacteria bacterium]
MNTHTKTLCASLLALACMSAALADTPIYKWVDEQGQVHYSTVPHDDKAQQLSIQNTSTPNAGTAVTPAPVAASAAPATDAQMLQPQPTDPPACKAGRARLAKYLHAATLFSTDDKGNKVRLSDAEKKQALDEAREYVREACGSGT